MKIALVSDSSRKTKGRMMADLMFAKSPLYRYVMNYCRLNFDDIFILSAKYYLIRPTDVIESYDEDINKFNEDSLAVWETYTTQMLWDEIPRKSEVHFFCGSKYRCVIRDVNKDFVCIEPTKNMRIGQQLRHFKQFETEFK